MEEEIENEKLIARFDDRLQLKKTKELQWYEDGIEWHGVMPNDIGTVRGSNQLKYHYLYDWIMPVIIKIHETSDDNTISFSGCKIFELGLTTPISELYEAVIEFLKWKSEQP